MMIYNFDTLLQSCIRFIRLSSVIIKIKMLLRMKLFYFKYVTDLA